MHKLCDLYVLHASVHGVIYQKADTHRIWNSYFFSTATMIRERSSLLRYTYIVCLVLLMFVLCGIVGIYVPGYCYFQLFVGFFFRLAAFWYDVVLHVVFTNYQLFKNTKVYFLFKKKICKLSHRAFLPQFFQLNVLVFRCYSPRSLQRL